jgi:hypothetical protein
MVQHNKIQTSSLRSELSKCDLDPGYFAKFLKDQIVRKFILDNKIDSLLDLGADTCYMNRLLTYSGWTGQYTGMDYRESAFPENLGENGQFIVTQQMLHDLNNLNLKYNSILLLDIIEHMSDKAEGLQLILAAFNRLENGGYLIITTPNSKDGIELCWPKYHEYEYNYTEVLDLLNTFDGELINFIGWSAKNDDFSSSNTVIPIEIARALWSIDNPALACDVMFIFKKN